MDANRTCPNCRKPLPADVPLGLCPECLIKSGFPTGTEPGAAAAGARFVPPPIEEIARLFPQLEILGLVGQGGMGAVYQARQPALNRFVALKVLPPATSSDPGFAERFNREARALARLNHSNIVAVHDFGKAGVLHYLVMEFVDGANLREVERAGRLAPEQALAIVPQICDALQFAHNEGIVHRDIKPENILLDKKGRVKITDFGSANAALWIILGAVATDSRLAVRGPWEVIAEVIRHEVGRQLREAGASYDGLEVTVAIRRDSATPFKVSCRGLQNFKGADGATPDAAGEFIMNCIGGGQWQGALA